MLEPKKKQTLVYKIHEAQKVNPFDGIDEGQTVEGVDLPPV